VGAKIAEVQKKYRLHADTDRMLEWRGPMLDLPSNLGRNRRPQEETSRLTPEGGGGDQEGRERGIDAHGTGE